MGLFGNNETITTTFAGKDNLSPVVRGIRTSMERFKRDLTDFTRKGGIQNALLGGVGMGAGLSAFSAISAGVGVVTGAIETSAKVLIQAAQAAAQDRAEQEQLARTLDNNVRGWRLHAGAIDDAIEASQRLAFEDTEVREGLATLSLRTHDVNEAIRLWNGSMNIARARGVSIKTAVDAVSKAYGGQQKALKSLGFDLAGTKTGLQAIEVAFEQAEGAAAVFADTAQGRLQVAIIELNEELETTGSNLPNLQNDIAIFAVNTTTSLVSAINQIASGINVLTGGRRGKGLITTLSDAFKETGGAAQSLNTDWRKTAATFERTARGAFDKAQDKARDLAAALGLVAENTRRAKNRGDDLDKTWKRLIQRGDGNRRTVRELTQDINMWERRFRRAVRNNDTEAAAFARVQADRAREERRQRRLVIATYGQQGRAVDRTKDKVHDLSREVEKANTLPDAYWTFHAEVDAPTQIPLIGGIVNFVQRRRRERRASGGRVHAGQEYIVGEDGPEVLQMGEQSGYVHPNAGSQPIVVQNHLYLDGNELKGWMLRTLAREASRSLTG